MLADLMSFFVPLVWVVERVVALVVAYMVYLDALKRDARLYDLAPIWWGLAVFFAGPLIGVAGYWLIHHSGISRVTEAAESP